MYCPDNYDMFLRHDAEQEAALEKLPTCAECGEPIQDEYCFMLNDELICETCLHDFHRKKTEDFIEW